jgi:hypothetical protein
VSITDRLEDAIINARIAGQMTGTGTDQPVTLTQEDAEALWVHNCRLLAALNDQIDVCTEETGERDPLTGDTPICNDYAVAWQQDRETGSWLTRCFAHLDEIDETVIWRKDEQ